MVREQVLTKQIPLHKHKMETTTIMMIKVPHVMMMKEQRVRKKKRKSRDNSLLLASSTTTLKLQILDKQIILLNPALKIRISNKALVPFRTLPRILQTKRSHKQSNFNKSKNKRIQSNS